MRMQRLAATVGAAALAVTLTACGNSSDKTDAGSGGNGGSGVAAALTQANFSQTVKAAQQKIQSAHMEATIKTAGQSASMSGDFSGFSGDVSSLSMDMTMKLAGQNLEVRLVDKALYVHGVGAMMQSKKPWVKIDLSDPNNPLTSIFNSANPQSFTAYLQAVKSLDDKGIETVDGVSTRHYTIVIDTAKAMAANPAFKGQDLSKLGMPATITTDVWLNSDNLPVKMSVGLGSVGGFVAHFSKYGEPVNVAAPPANQVSSLKIPN
jgi:hypothetical protein